jgi:hypothetical protein
MSVGNYNSVTISVGNKKKTIPMEMTTALQTDMRAKLTDGYSVGKIQR